MVKVSGSKSHSDRLKRMAGPRTRSLTDRALYAAGQMIEMHAEVGITTGSISGKGHIPSGPGDFPNADSRLLDTSIHTVVVGPNRVNVESTAPYSAALEWGTSRMAARPFMAPSARAKRKEATELIAEAVRRSTK